MTDWLMQAVADARAEVTLHRAMWLVTVASIVGVVALDTPRWRGILQCAANEHSPQHGQLMPIAASAPSSFAAGAAWASVCEGCAMTICPICGGVVKKQRSRHQRTYCSRSCQGVAHSRKHPRVWGVVECKNCHQPFKVDATQIKFGNGKFCSIACRGQFYSGPNNPRYKGGYVRPDGYREVVNRGHRELEHRVVLAEKIGTDIPSDMCTHHVNGNKSDNRPENLELWSLSAHAHHHATGRRHTAEAIARMRIAAKRRKRDAKGSFVKDVCK